MALPTLDATFASSADLPRKQMLAKWLVEELGETQAPSDVLISGAGSSEVNGIYTLDGQEEGKNKYVLNGNFITWSGSQWVIYDDVFLGDFAYASLEDTEFPWQVAEWSDLAGESPAPTVTEIPKLSPLSNYYSLPERYLWAKIAVAAGAPKTEADYISLPKNYVWSDIYNAVSGDIANSTVVVSGAGSAVNGSYTKRGEDNGKPYYSLVGQPDNTQNYSIWWEGTEWEIYRDSTIEYYSAEDVSYPWLVTNWVISEGVLPMPTVTPQTPNHTDWSENVALGHIAAAYRGDTANPANLATYIDWPWRYKVASIIQAL